MDPAHGIAQSQVREVAKGGAIAKATLGGLVGSSLILLANNLPDSAAINPPFSPWQGLIAGSLVGALGMGLIGAISSRNAPKIKSGTEAVVSGSDYKLMLAGTRNDVFQAAEILAQQSL